MSYRSVRDVYPHLNLTDLHTKLRQAQGCENDTTFAARLGISRIQWSTVKHRHVPIGMKLVRGAIKEGYVTPDGHIAP